MMRTRNIPEVLTRTKRSTRLLVLLAVVVLGAALSAALRMTQASAGGPSAEWRAVATDLSGTPIAAAASTRSVAKGTTIDLSAVRTLGSVKFGSDSATLLVAPSATDSACFSVALSYAQSAFSCLSDLTADDPALVVFSADGGPDLSQTTKAFVFGIARGDVGRVTVNLRDGTSVAVPVRGHVFSYSAGTGAALPADVTAADGSGTALQTLQVG